MNNTFKQVLKLCTKLFLFLLPVILYFCVFIYFEPYNYFELKQDVTDTNQPIYRVRNYIKNPEDAILIGDSRMAHLDVETINNVSGKSFSNLAFGGASQQEINDLFYFAIEENPSVDTVYLQVSFYTLNAQYDKDRIGDIKKTSENALSYMFNFNYNVEMLRNMVNPVTDKSKATATYDESDYLDENGNILSYRSQLLSYCQAIYPNISSYDVKDVPLSMLEETFLDPARLEDNIWALNETEFDRLLEIAEYCEQNDIELTFVFPPMHEVLLELCMKPLGIEVEMLKVIDALNATTANVVDYELTERYDIDEALFYDGFHMDEVLAMDGYINKLFGENP